MSLPYLQPYLGLSNGLNTLHAAGGGAGGAVGGWVEVGRTTLGSAGDTISVGSLADKRYYMCLLDGKVSGDVVGALRLNSDSGSNYSNRYQINGGADSTNVNSTQGYFHANGWTTNAFSVGYLANYATKEKLSIVHTINQNTAGAGNVPNRNEVVNKHAQTSNPISAISANNTSSGDYASGSEVVVLGYDPLDSHTNNFWEELDSVDLSGGAGDNLDFGAVPSKKYYWLQAFFEASGSIRPYMQLNNDTGANYAQRRSENGGADVTSANRTNIIPDFNIRNNNVFWNCFIVNNASNEKLGFIWTVDANTSGAGNAPIRSECVFKWTNTSSQINDILLLQSESGDFGTNSIAKLWGAD